MSDLFVFLNHQLTIAQRNEAMNTFGIASIIFLPDDLRSLWSNIPPYNDLDLSILSRFTGWLIQNAKKGDYVLVQGEYGAVFYIVDCCFQKDYIPIYATTQRKSHETVKADGTIERNLIFQHTSFRRYHRWESNQSK